MLDLVESMVHRFKEKVGYNLFDDCAAIADELEGTDSNVSLNDEVKPLQKPANGRNTSNSISKAKPKAPIIKPPTRGISSSIMSLSELGNTTSGSLDSKDDTDTRLGNNTIDPKEMEELKNKIKSLVITVIDRLTDGSVDFTFDSIRHFQARMTHILSEEISLVCDDYLQNKTEFTFDVGEYVTKIVTSLNLN